MRAFTLVVSALVLVCWIGFLRADEEKVPLDKLPKAVAETVIKGRSSVCLHRKKAVAHHPIMHPSPAIAATIGPAAVRDGHNPLRRAKIPVADPRGLRNWHKIDRESRAEVSTVGDLLRERGETVAVAEGSAGGLVSAALLIGLCVYVIARDRSLRAEAARLEARRHGRKP